jgi:cyclopropane fatty-acyl-phospholipid synthase-like methyltransferase
LKSANPLDFSHRELENKAMSNSNMILEDYAVMRYGSSHSILRSELIYGEGFQSPGGIAGFRSELGDKIPVTPGIRMLDVGSGLGGAAFYFAEKTEVEIVGLDTSPIMTELATSRQDVKDPFRRVAFLNADIHTADLDEQSFDVIYSRDTLMYERNKPSFFERCFSLLKKGGSIYIADFCKNNESEEFAKFESSSGYELKTIAEYSKIISHAGFESLISEDISLNTVKKLTADLNEYRTKAGEKDYLIQKTDADHIVGRWLEKIRLLDTGCLAQGLFIGVKS